MQPQNRDQAQQRADDIQAFQREAERLRQEQALPLDDAQMARLSEHHRRVLADFHDRFDIDSDKQTRRLSLSMRIASLLGALALGASLLFFFYQFWGLLPESAQVLILGGAPLLGLALTWQVRRRDPSGYFSKLAAMLTFVAFVLNLVMLGQIFNITPSDRAFLAWGAFALLLAYGCDARLLLVAGLICLMGFVSARVGSWGGCYWLQVGERPENFIPAALGVFLIPQFISQAGYAGFAATYRLVGLITLFLTLLILANWGSGSYLPGSHDLIEGGYQLAGFVLAALGIWLGTRRDWPEVVNGALTFFIIFLYTKLFDWWWELMPKYLFFLLLGLIAVLILVVLGRLRRSWLNGEERP
ncbi:DUF2157 domain-containing protein [Pseudomonas tohonis]|nr:hypothetical protein L682_00740 [Pseudomonas alcaligenes OT 69]MDN4145862.1 DUF2157 domain-containing protein [Pseudomonas tohonis]